MITVFTPTYNRVTLLAKVYKSLILQTPVCFEWLIVDDGSTDDTFQYINSIQKENQFEIRYYYQDNAGKHVAINYGATLAKGELFFIVDSDEVLVKDALLFMQNVYNQIADKDDFAGISGLKSFFNGMHIGRKLDYTYLDCSTIDYNLKFKYGGEMAVAYKTNVLLKYPFPSFVGEKYCGEGLIWYKIALRYKLRYFSQPVIFTDYYPDGLTALGVKKRVYSPQTTLVTYSELSKMDIPVRYRIKFMINFWRFFFCDEQNSWRIKIKMMDLYTVIFFPLGYFLYLIDHLKK